MTLRVIEPDERHQGPILVTDEMHNDVAEFFHDEHATVSTTYEQALSYATALCGAA